KISEVAVQNEPNGVALTPDGRKAFVANTAAGTVSVIRLRNGDDDDDDNDDKDDHHHRFALNDFSPHRTKNIRLGTRPSSLVMAPNGSRLYVANARSNSISVINVNREVVIATIENVGLEPRGLAITNNGNGNDLDELLYVTQFLSSTIPGKIDGADDAKAG